MIHHVTFSQSDTFRTPCPAGLAHLFTVNRRFSGVKVDPGQRYELVTLKTRPEFFHFLQNSFVESSQL